MAIEVRIPVESGAYSPTPLITDRLEEKIMENVMRPTLKGLSNLGIKFRGFLYAGLMIGHGSNEPYVLEFNVRMEIRNVNLFSQE